MERIWEILEGYGLAGLVIAGLVYVIGKYLLPVIKQIGETNAKQAESLVQVSENLAKIDKVTNELPDQIEAAKQEIIQEIKKG